MPFDSARMDRLRALKNNMKQADLARIVGVTQTFISQLSGKEPSVEVLEKIADALDCTTDFLLHRTDLQVDDDDEKFRAVASRMAFTVFETRTDDVGKRQRCQRVLGHRAAPVTSLGWEILSEQIELAIGPTSPGDMRVVPRTGTA